MDGKTVWFTILDTKKITASVTILPQWQRSACSPCLSPSIPCPREQRYVFMEEVLPGENKCQRKTCRLLPFNDTFPLLLTHHVDFLSCSRKESPVKLRITHTSLWSMFQTCRRVSVLQGWFGDAGCVRLVNPGSCLCTDPCQSLGR